jgi:hypothetical protein
VAQCLGTLRKIVDKSDLKHIFDMFKRFTLQMELYVGHMAFD